MLVVSNTSPLRYLVEVRAIDVLPTLYDHIMTTPHVIAELRQEHFPDAVRLWAESTPPWLDIASPAIVRFRDRLDEGEASALSLACERQANLILIDERAGRDTARGVGIEPRGTLGILIWAGASGHLDFETAIRDLITRTRFRFTPDVIDNARRQYEALRRDLHNRSNGSGREP